MHNRDQIPASNHHFSDGLGFADAKAPVWQWDMQLFRRGRREEGRKEREMNREIRMIPSPDLGEEILSGHGLDCTSNLSRLRPRVCIANVGAGRILLPLPHW